MKISATTTWLGLALTLVCTTTANAQTSAQEGGAGGSGGLSASSLGQTTSGMGMTTNSTGQTTGSGTSGTTTTQTSNTSSTGTTSGAQGFIGGNATENFVGGARQATGQQGANRQFQAFQSSQTTTQTTSSSTPREIRTVLSIGFQFPAATVASQTGRLANANSVSMSRFSSNRQELAGIEVNLNSQGVAVLTGSSPSTEASRLAANLMRLQPGVRKVDNQIAVTP